jgi:hypothetical protein
VRGTRHTIENHRVCHHFILYGQSREAALAEGFPALI